MPVWCALWSRYKVFNDSIIQGHKNTKKLFLFFQSFDQFETEGCDNCEEFLRMKNNKDNVYDCTSNNFDGLIAVMSPEDSWVCKWQRISEYIDEKKIQISSNRANN